MRYLLISLVVFLFSGCLSTTVPPKAEFRLNPEISHTNLSAIGCKDKSLKVAQAFSSSELMSQSMSYAQGGIKQYTYSKSQWSSTPNRAITAEFLKLIRDSKLFKSVQVSKSRSKNDFILEINIEDFMQYFCEKALTSHSKVLISLTLINSKTNKVIATQTFTAGFPIENLNANGGVEGLNKALSSVLSQSSIWFDEVCR